MRMAILVFALCALGITPALADSSTDVGALVGVAAGQHISTGQPATNGIAPAALLEFTERVDGFRLHLEGFPSITASGISSGPFGHSSATISLLDAILEADVLPKSLLRVGGGVQMINLSNFNANDGSTNSTHLSVPIFAIGSTLPLLRDHFAELTLYTLPNVRANLNVFNNAGVAQPTIPEQGAEVYYSAAYGWRHGAMSYLLGLSGLSYHTRNTNDGSLVDRNAGGALTFELRYRFGSMSRP